MKEFQETLYDAVAQTYRIDKMYFEQKTDHQHLMIFHNAFLGRVMTLDGIVQTTEKDEFIKNHQPVINPTMTLSRIPTKAPTTARDIISVPEHPRKRIGSLSIRCAVSFKSAIVMLRNPRQELTSEQRPPQAQRLWMR